MLSWADLEAIKQNSGHHPVEKNEVNHHHQMVHPVVVDTPTETLTFRNKQLALHGFFPNSGCYQTKCVERLVF